MKLNLFGLSVDIGKRGIENPATSIREGSEWLLDSLGGHTAASGVRVNEQTAMRSSAVWGCIRVLSSSIGSLPLVVYERTDKGRRVAREHHLYSMLHDAPNQSMSSMTWRQVQQVHVTATGNSYAYIKRGERTKRPQEIIPLMPSSVTPIRKNGEILYEITLDNGEKQTVDAWRILHIPGMGFDGLVGYSPIRMAADNIGLSLAAQEFGGKFFGNGASPGGVLEHPKNIGDKAWERLKAGYDSYGGLGNAHKTLILEEGMKLHQTVIPPEEAQFLETRKFQVEDIARIYGVPLIMLSATEKATSWGTGLEQQNLGFLIHTLRPWLVAHEQELNRKLLLPSERERFYIEFKLDALLRGDTKSRYEGYAIARQWGWMSINDVRRYENMDEVEGGDQYMVPLNMRPHDEPADEQSSDILQASFISQMIKREYNGLKSKIGAEDLSEWFEGFSGKTRQDLFTLGLNRDQVDSFISSALANTDKIDDWTTYRSNELMTLIRGQK